MKKILPLIVAVVLGLVAVLGVQNYLKKKDEEYREKVRPKQVIVAQRNIKSGEQLTLDILAIREFPEAMLPENVVTSQDKDSVLYQPVSRDFSQGEPLLWTYLGTPKAAKAMSQVIRADERAITISVDNVAGVDGYIQPNDRVDIYVSIKIPDTKKQQVPTKDSEQVTMIDVDTLKPVTFILLQNVTVLATGSSFFQEQVATDHEYHSVTLAVTPMEAALVKFASENGSLCLALRNSQDFGEASKVEIIEMNTILDLAKLRELQEDRKKRVEVYRQGKMQVVER
ncbi:MAG: Flp pilus assembly protein CpaB [Candidatus Aureabacteria bacterium]|nr:Flp pilus assembly protein CpaB [Candidatus Auribacterota bacterium]